MFSPLWSTSNTYVMHIEILVSHANNLPNVERYGKSDPYVTIGIQGIKKKTQVKESDLDPVWNETLIFDLAGKSPSADEVIEIVVKDYERLGRNRLLGSANLSLRNVLSGPSDMEMDLNLIDKNQQTTPAILHLKISYQKPDEDKGGTGTGVIVQSQQQTPTTAMPGVLATDKPTAHINALDMKVESFQVRVKVVEGRQLNGSNLYPACSVKAFKQSRTTRVCRATSNPSWDELFFFHVTTSPAEMVDMPLHFEVFNSKVSRSKALIGQFKLTAGYVFSQHHHACINKWLLLSDPNDLINGVTGYLKMSVAILGPGDDAPNFTGGDQDDIETNLLRPSGIQLRPATFTLDVFHAEDLPRMDSGFVQGLKKLLDIGKVYKELVDPYLIFGFAGKEVQTKVLYNSDHPSWNSKVHLGFMFPSMCNNVTLTIKDWDRLTEDDTIATAHIQIPHISAAGENGFLPSFGPSFVNFYGSPREYATLGYEHDDKLNSNKMEGCAYRGRVLVSLRTTLGSYPSIPSLNLDEVDIWRVESFSRRRRFILNAVLVDAWMVNEINSPVEFEVSIGNYGNKFEQTTVPSPSSSQPTNAVFDGCQYYFLPWTEAKPLITVPCQWEDITYRLEAFNILQRTVRHLKRNVQMIHAGRKAELPVADLAVSFVAMMDQLIADCSQTLPQPVPGSHPCNELDVMLANMRKAELVRIVAMATALRENATQMDDALQETETYLDILQSLAIEPQSSIPDVIVWMIADKKRIAYRRIPAHCVLFSSALSGGGKYCGQLQTITLKVPGGKQPHKIPAKLRLRLWLGLEKYNDQWLEKQDNVQVAIFAETYENQVSVIGKWGNSGPAMSRPAFSDAAGLSSLPKDKFNPPANWTFDGDWFLAPELSTMYNSDAGHRIFLEDVFENQNRIPGGNWISAITPWTDVRGDPSNARDGIQCPQGWEWEDVWKFDVKRAVDEEGWEYTLEATFGGFTPCEKTYHLCRRRRWVRQRRLLAEETDQKQLQTPTGTDGGWEYAALFSCRFHSVERKMDFVRRRRWHRKMISEHYGQTPVFNFGAEKISDEDASAAVTMSCPRFFLIYNEVHKYQLRVYVFQARKLLSGDKSGLSDPYASIVFLSRSQMTDRVRQTLCPVWDSSLIFDDVHLYGNVADVRAQPPLVIAEIFDHDAYGEPDFLGRAQITPVVHLDSSSAFSAKLDWCPVTRAAEDGGEILASAELYLAGEVELPFLPPKIGSRYMVPSGIRPVLQRTIIEVLCWGVRNLKTFEYSSINNPSVEVEFGNQVFKTKYLKDVKENLNFENPLMVVEMMLPKDELYMPPVNVKLRDHRSFGRSPIVGMHVINSLNLFNHVHESAVQLEDKDVPDGDHQELVLDPFKPETVIQIETDVNKDENIDWWSKYFASVGDQEKCLTYIEKGFETLEVYPTELERVPKFQGFNDFLQSFSFTRGKNKDDDGEDTFVGEMKGTLKVYAVPGDPNAVLPPRVLQHLPSSKPEEVLVRVYVVRARDLAAKDANSLADPYVEVKLGKTKVTSRDNYKPNTLNPIFGLMFELTTKLPLHKDLRIRIIDYDKLSKDDLIGETHIDLENRRFSTFRATCGLPKKYHVSGPNKWRDGQSPSAILEEICSRQLLPKPQFQGKHTLVIGSTAHSLRDYERGEPVNRHLGPAPERLALSYLNTLNLVPEHVETRRLLNPALPGLEQGKLEMWVDIYPTCCGSPGPPVDIQPRIPSKYILRCVIHNTCDVVLQETNIFGEKMSDIYVKGWVAGVNHVEKTDVHYRSLDGEGNFNWRFVFPIDYLPSEQLVVVKRKDHTWSLDEREQRVSPKLCLQIWDNDKFSFDDFLGEIELNLVKMTPGVKAAKDCTLSPKSDEVINLFDKKRVMGFWPCTNVVDGERQLTGKIEMEIEVISEEAAKTRPAGSARDEPNANPHLEPPNRPATSFLWLTSPWKSFKFVVWRRYKWYFITFIVILILGLFALLFLYNIPEASIRKIFGS